ncbi:hypothetical protein HRI_005068400 [Hibiscus trionum]|uniref:Cytochrome P450 n=1 Tax=Hibiscus trionum TaxID=183268 RepID=A0A9W7MUN5_HIBTR|nr:hypothetical protein HRI_005068400 [Hibiscus trionum]
MDLIGGGTDTSAITVEWAISQLMRQATEELEQREMGRRNRHSPTFLHRSNHERNCWHFVLLCGSNHSHGCRLQTAVDMV